MDLTTFGHGDTETRGENSPKPKVEKPKR